MRFIKGPMRSRSRSSRVGLLAVAVLLVGCSDGCKKTVNTTPTVVTAPSIFRPATEVQSKVVATVNVKGFEGTLEKVGTLASKLGLPFGAAQLRDMLVAQSGLPAPLLAHLDLSQPVGASVVGREKDKTPFVAVAAAAKSAKDAIAFLAELGTKLGEDKGAIHIKAADGSEPWIFAMGSVLVGSDSLEGLQAAGAQAMAARQTTGDDVVVTLFPPAMALSQGTDLRKAMVDGRNAMMAEVKKQAEHNPSPMPPEVTEKILTAFVDPYIDQLADTKAVDVALAIDPAVGLKMFGRVHPVEGSPFAKSVAKVTPYEVDPALASTPLKAGLFAIRYSPETLKRYSDAMQSLGEISLPGMKAMGEGIQAMMKSLDGGYSGTFSFDAGMNYAFVSPLVACTDPVAFMNTADQTFGPQGMGALFKEFAKHHPKGSKTPIPRLAWKRQGLKGRLEFPLAFGGDAKAEKSVRMMLGSDKLTYLIAVAAGKLYGIVGPNSDAELVRLSTHAAAPVDLEVQQILNETKGREGFGYMDVFGIVRPILQTMAKTEPSLAQANAMLSFIPGVEKIRVPMIMSYVGGRALTGEWFIPLRAFENVSTILRPLFGMGMGSSGGALAPGAN